MLPGSNVRQWLIPGMIEKIQVLVEEVQYGSLVVDENYLLQCKNKTGISGEKHSFIVVSPGFLPKMHIILNITC